MRHRWPLSSLCNLDTGDVPHGRNDGKAALSSDWPQPDQVPDGRRRLALVLEYEGTKYSGFQWQTNVPSIQSEVERAIECFTGETTRVRGASRTDAGVHARGQVVDFLTAAPDPTDTVIKALNWHLPPDIKVRGAWVPPSSFNARKDAASRVYRYTLLNARWPSAMLRGFCHWVRSPLDLDKMREAAGHLSGTHDFSALAGALPQGRSPVRRVERWDVRREGELVFIEAEANGFLPHQILRTNGMLVEIGLGKRPVQVMKEIINGTLRELRHYPSLPPKGLCLMQVNYPNMPFGNDKHYEA